jgi:hypothetical protein
MTDAAVPADAALCGKSRYVTSAGAETRAERAGNAEALGARRGACALSLPVLDARQSLEIPPI